MEPEKSDFFIPDKEQEYYLPVLTTLDEGFVPGKHINYSRAYADNSHGLNRRTFDECKIICDAINATIKKFRVSKPTKRKK